MMGAICLGAGFQRTRAPPKGSASRFNGIERLRRRVSRAVVAEQDRKFGDRDERAQLLCERCPSELGRTKQANTLITLEFEPAVRRGDERSNISRSKLGENVEASCELDMFAYMIGQTIGRK